MKNSEAITFPNEMTLKVIGRNDEAFETAVLQIVHQAFPNLKENALRYKASKKEKYTSMNITLLFSSENQYVELLTSLQKCDQVIIVL